MLYTNKLWNGNYLNYDLILPKDRKIRKSVHIMVLPVILVYMAICFCLLSATLLFDTYRIVRFKCYKSDNSLYRLIHNTHRHMIG